MVVRSSAFGATVGSQFLMICRYEVYRSGEVECLDCCFELLVGLECAE